MIFIVIDNDVYPAAVVGVFGNHEDCEEYVLAHDPEEESTNLGLSVVTWDIVRNVELV